MSHENDVLLALRDVSVTYHTRSGTVEAVAGVDLDIREDEVFGLVGESGSGKSTLGLAILRMLHENAAQSGTARFGQRDLFDLPEPAMRLVRWNDIAYIPQGAMNSLNPVMRVRQQFSDAMVDHGLRLGGRRLRDVLAHSLAGVNLEVDVLDRYPHQLSGGMKQRVCIALAMLLSPRLIIADEPTSALDVVSQRIVIEALARVRRRTRTTVLLIGHDMALQAQAADRVGIMYRGRLLEVGPTQSVFRAPRHEYTRKLISAVPDIRKRVGIRELARQSAIEIEVAPGGAMREVEPGHFVLMREGDR